MTLEEVKKRLNEDLEELQNEIVNMPSDNQNYLYMAGMILQAEWTLRIIESIDE